MRTRLFNLALLALFAVMVCIPFLGCTSTLTGAGTFRLGVTNSNFIEFGHTVDGDKVGKEATAQLEFDENLLDRLIAPKTPEASTPDSE